MYCNITQLSVKKKDQKRNKNYLFMYSSLSGSTFPPPLHFHGPNCAPDSVQVSRAQFYNPIFR